jgi:hypothetical protein
VNAPSGSGSIDRTVRLPLVHVRGVFDVPATRLAGTGRHEQEVGPREIEDGVLDTVVRYGEQRSCVDERLSRDGTVPTRFVAHIVYHYLHIF